MKAKLAKYRGQLLEPSGKKGEKGEGFDVLKSGDARAVMIGFPSVGKVGYFSYWSNNIEPQLKMGDNQYFYINLI